MDRLHRVLGAIDKILGVVETIGLVVTLGVAALISFLLIAARNLVNVSYNSFEEISVYLVFWMVFIGMAAADRARANISIDILMHVLPKRGTDMLRRFADMLTAALALFLAWQALEAVLFSHRIGERAVSTLEVQIWPLMAIMPVCFLIVAFRASYRTIWPPAESRALESAH